MSNATTTGIMLSWQQELPTDDLIEYAVEVRYVGPCPSLVGMSTSLNFPIETRDYEFENLREFGTYVVTVTVLSMINEMASSSITVQTLPEGTYYLPIQTNSLATLCEVRAIFTAKF